VPALAPALYRRAADGRADVLVARPVLGPRHSRQQQAETGFTPHEVSWTPERVMRFWAYLSNSPQADRAYFSSHSGDAIIAFAQRYVPLGTGRVLDYGCGPGFLLERLLRRGIRAEGIEFSSESVDQVQKRCGDHPLFGGILLADGVPTPIESESVDVVFLVEVLEHLPGEQLGQALEDIRRILRVGGFLVATMPHNEDLEALKTICPDCGCIFHPWQHVNSFRATNLTEFMQTFGFEAVVCTATTFSARWVHKAMRLLRRVLAGRNAGRGEPHLVYVGKKRPNTPGEAP
ncbi:MAG: class I SAM-dependent methyltransferase, partial [bacterium]